LGGALAGAAAGGGAAGSLGGELQSVKKDLDFIMGRSGDETSEISGVPSLVSAGQTFQSGNLMDAMRSSRSLEAFTPAKLKVFPPFPTSGRRTI